MRGRPPANTTTEESTKKTTTSSSSGNAPRVTRGRVGRPSNAQLQEKQALQAQLQLAQNIVNDNIIQQNEENESIKKEEETVIIEEVDDPTVDVEPFPIGNSLVVKYRDGSDRLAKIIEHMEYVTTDKGNDKRYKYYVHYNDFNRRMDEWVEGSRIVSIPSVANRLQRSYNSTRRNHSTDNNLSTVADIEHDEHEGLDEASLREHEKVTRVKNIRFVQLGKYIMECWYFSPFPKEYFPTGFTEYIYFCEFSMRFFKTKQELIRYQTKSPSLNRYPPGNEIYRDDVNGISMFEIDGAIEKIYCQNLCYFAKLFLDHKTLYWDVDVFLFYVLCTRDERGFHPVGYYSKEKYSELGYNLACILTFPCYQRKGYGRLLIEFSYELSKKEEKVGSPEKPLSDLGAVGFRSYWANTILKLLKQSLYHGYSSMSESNSSSSSSNNETKLSIVDIMMATSILPEDIVTTLVMLNIFIPKQGTSNDVLNNSSASASGSGNNSAGDAHGHGAPTMIIENIQDYFIYAPLELLDKLLEKYPENKIKVDSDKLHWAPFYVMDNKKDKWTLTAMKASVQQAATVTTIIQNIQDTNASTAMDVDNTYDDDSNAMQ